jgi:molybdenum cofactor cytidylyltransferase
VDELIVVVGAEREAVIAALDGLDLRVVENGAWRDGIGGSIAAGVRAASGSAVLLLLADQPAVDAALLAELVAGFAAGHARVACAYEGVVGVPALFADPDDLAALRELSGELGAQKLLRRAGVSVLTVRAERAAHDIDDEADWRRWQEASSS